MQLLVGILVGLAAGLLLAATWRGQKAVAPAAEAGCTGGWAGSHGKRRGTPSVTETLTARLHSLEAVFAPLASNYAHPRELEEQRDFAEAVRLLQSPDVPLDTVMQYVPAPTGPLACAALAALIGRADRGEAVDDVVAHFDKLYPWPMYFALEYFLVAEPRPPVGAPVAGAKDWWCENLIVPGLFRDYFAAAASAWATRPTFGSALQATLCLAARHRSRPSCKRVNHPHAAALIGQLDTFQRASIDRALPRLVRPLLGGPQGARAPGRARGVARGPGGRRDRVAADAGALAARQRRAPRGQDDVPAAAGRRGSTGEGWEVFEAGGADLMAGQQWFGQLEGRIQRTVEELAAAKKLIWYIPDILQLARSGTHQGQAASILDQILPAIVLRPADRVDRGDADRARRACCSCGRCCAALFEVVRLEPQIAGGDVGARAAPSCSAWRTRPTSQIEPRLRAGRAQLGAPVSERRQLPGLGARSHQAHRQPRRSRAASSEVEAREVIVTLSQLTGLPVSILDSNERVDLASIRDYFTGRVIGQDEAVAAIVDRIAMLKAGLERSRQADRRVPVRGLRPAPARPSSPRRSPNICSARSTA